MTSLTRTRQSLRGNTPFVYALLANFVWINVSEVFRYFAFIMPMMRKALPMLPDAAPMNLTVFLIWGLWDTILVIASTTIVWMALTIFAPTLRNTLVAGTGVWITIFGLIWIGIYNMNLTTWPVVLTALPLAWVEMIIAALIVRRICFGNEVVHK
ncbi:MAG: hypothetical protein WBD37_03350 [Anderseniella sp.]